MSIAALALIIILLAIFITLYNCACIVPQKKAYLVERLGRYRATLGAEIGRASCRERVFV